MSDSPRKKPFSEPKLVTYGDIQKITSAVGKVGATDIGGKGSKTKTR